MAGDHYGLQQTFSVGGIIIRPYLIGDGAYPFSPALIKRYRGGGLSDAQRIFNSRFSSGRICVEHAFGRLKRRWQILQKPLKGSLASHVYVIAACCMLHNICEGDPLAYGNFEELARDAPAIARVGAEQVSRHC